jgi:hypothetical protein
LNIKKQETFEKRGKKESLDCDLVWTWTTICIYKKTGYKNMDGQKSTYFSPLVMLKI